MHAIERHGISLLETQEMTLRAGSRILTVRSEDENIYLYVLTPSSWSVGQENVTIRIIDTWGSLSDAASLRYVGSFSYVGSFDMNVPWKKDYHLFVQDTY